MWRRYITFPSCREKSSSKTWHPPLLKKKKKNLMTNSQESQIHLTRQALLSCVPGEQEAEKGHKGSISTPCEICIEQNGFNAARKEMIKNIEQLDLEQLINSFAGEGFNEGLSRAFELIHEHDPQSGQTVSQTYWGITLRDALKKEKKVISPLLTGKQ